MRIISHGDLQELGQIYCDRCHCLFGYNKDDLQYSSDTHNLSVEAVTPYVICPECGRVITVAGVQE